MSFLNNDSTFLKHLQEYADEQEAAVRLLCVINPRYKDLIFDEVQRRADAFREFYQVTPVGASKPVMLLAFESVYQDAIRGYFG